jgi:hypothetical protein
MRQYIEYFRRQVSLVESLQGDESINVGASEPQARVKIHRKILHAALLDSLAGVRYAGCGLRNRERFVNLLQEHSAWTSGGLVSVPVLAKRLDGNSSDLKQHLDCILAKYSTDRGNSLSVTAFDVAPASLDCLAQDQAERLHIAGCVHYELAYRYRNFIVHEFREPGYAMESFSEGDEPRYHGYLNDSCWHLLYPGGFFASLVASVLTSLEAYYVANEINPYQSVMDSSTW